MTDNSAEKMVWRFSYQMWNKNWLEGMFVATQEEIDWIEDKAINFGDKGNNGLDVVVRMDPEYFKILNSDPEFVEQFQRTIKDTGNTPFISLDREQHAEWESEFGEIYGVEVPDNSEEPEPTREAFEDQDSRVITYDDLTGDIFNYKYNDEDEQSEEMDKFLAEFEILLPSRNSYLLAEEVNFSGDSFECMNVIKRKSDGQLYGYKYYESVSTEHGTHLMAKNMVLPTLRLMFGSQWLHSPSLVTNSTKLFNLSPLIFSLIKQLSGSILTSKFFHG